MTKTFEKSWQVDCAYPNGGDGIGLLSDVEEALRSAVGDSESSGSGFGMRDHQYGPYDTEAEASEVEKKITEVFEKVGIKNINGEGRTTAYISLVEMHKDCGTQHEKDEKCPMCSTCKGFHEENEPHEEQA